MEKTSMSHDRVRAMVEAALMLALAYALDNFVPPFYRFPQGGSIDLSMLPILVYCLRWGPKWSLSCCFVNGVLQYFLGGGIYPGVHLRLRRGEEAGLAVGAHYRHAGPLAQPDPVRSPFVVYVHA